MQKIALTGNIGSGKTTVSKIFMALRVPVYNADEKARLILFRDDICRLLADTFGPEVLDAKGTPDKVKLATLVFNNDDSLRKLNAIIHPLVISDFENWATQYESNPYVLLESAIVFENKLESVFDSVIVVIAPENQRIDRVATRDNFSTGQILERIKNQMRNQKK